MVCFHTGALLSSLLGFIVLRLKFYCCRQLLVIPVKNQVTNFVISCFTFCINEAPPFCSLSKGGARNVINRKFPKTMHHDISSVEEFFSEFYADTFSDCPSNIYTSVSEDGSSSEYSSDSDSVNVIPTKRKTLVIDSDPESKNETHGAGKCSFASAKECRRYFTKIGRLNRCVRYNC